MMRRRPPYPLSAIVGQEDLVEALLVCAVHPVVGGVLVRGERVTAKSTAVRALAPILDAAARPVAEAGATAGASSTPLVDLPLGASSTPLVELPLGATLDRLVGTLDLRAALAGDYRVEQGMLARADGGVLYVDEVNLLPDHLVDVLLDAAAMGRVHVERDGISHSHESRFVLIGTMNPEEGELRPQLLDRFGLTVDVNASRDVPERAQVIKARMAYEADPLAFAARYAEQDAELAEKIALARKRVDGVTLPDAEVDRIASVCAAFDVDGMRADIVIARTAIAHAAWRDADTVTAEDIRVAAELALPHRRRRDPFDDPGVDPGQLDDALAKSEGPRDPDPDSDPEPDPDSDPDPSPAPLERDSPREPSEESSEPRSDSARAPTRPSATPSAAFRTRALRVPGVGDGAPGRRSRARNRSGAVVSASDDIGAGHGVHLFATVLAAASRSGGGAPRPAVEDLRGAIRVGREGNLVIFVVDASGSMAARDRMAAVSGAALSLLRDAYQRRDKVAVITFRQDHARILLPPTSSAHIAGRRLTRFDTGGKSPIAEGLLAAREMVIRERVRDRTRRPLVVVLTDGRATGGPDPLGRSRLAAAALVAERAAAVVVDCETSYVRLGLAERLAGHLEAPMIGLAQLQAGGLTEAVRGAA
jgi:magnesium chelatase subunit D